MHRLSQVARKLNVGSTTILDFLKGRGHEVDSSPNSKITNEQFELLSKEYASSVIDKEEASSLTIGSKHSDDLIIKEPSSSIETSLKEEDLVLITDNIVKPNNEEVLKREDELIPKPKLEGTKVVGKIDLEAKKSEAKIFEKTQKVEESQPEEKSQEVKETLNVDSEVSAVESSTESKVPNETAKPQEVDQVSNDISDDIVVSDDPVTPDDDFGKRTDIATSEADTQAEGTLSKEETIKAKANALKGLKVLGKIELPAEKKKPIASSDEHKDRKKRPRKRIQSNTSSSHRPPTEKK